MLFEDTPEETVRKNEELRIKNKELRIQNEELRIQNEELCIKNKELCIEMMNFAGLHFVAHERVRPCGPPY